ncbi:MAG: UDP-N-acetylmuramate--L-alanine ligase [Candidatus Bipolaricaulota bacterium]|nr:UDP-N-acetylmuramate--L-alanine ligase [Candidatus Bipolaricaulota bacterium]MBS3791692.1 UDP-N-acetylmuramate--L-alanine ligase [Candidatus Bipolaricaulota bacterium]
MFKINPDNKYHLIGIGGDGMSGLARVLLQLGASVVGSDIRECSNTRVLCDAGAEVYIGHRSSNLTRDVDAVVVSSAISEDNVEVREAKSRGIPVQERLTALAKLMEEKKSVAIAGTHGKTTTTTMTSTLFEFGGKDPTYMIGANCDQLDGNAKLGDGEHFISEVDESDGHFTELSPDLSVITNIGKDHLDTYRDQDEILEGFKRFAGKSDEMIICADDRNSRKLYDVLSSPFTFGIDSPADITAQNISQVGVHTSFDLHFRGKKLGRIDLPAPGRHNVYNALAALSLGYKSGMDFSKMMDIMGKFQLPNRRFQILQNNGSIIVDDYAHLPKEIEVTLNAVKEGWNPNRILAVFQPHRFSRTKHINGQFGNSFESADMVVITGIYPASETPIPGVTSQLIQKSVEKTKKSGVHRILDREELYNFVNNTMEDGDFLIGLGAGDINQFTQSLADS